LVELFNLILSIINPSRQSKIRQLDTKPLIYEYIGTLEISVHVLFPVHVLEYGEQLSEDTLGLQVCEPVSHVEYTRQVVRYVF